MPTKIARENVEQGELFKMSKANFVTGLRAVETLLSQRAAEILKLYAEYQTANPRLEAVIAHELAHIERGDLRLAFLPSSGGSDLK